MGALLHSLAKSAVKNIRVFFYAVLTEIILLAVLPSGLFAFELTGYIQSEGKVFFNRALFSRQQRSSLSLALQPELYHEWESGSSFILTPFLRIDNADAERSNFDIRELNFLWVHDTWELRIGVGKVFWGVTEFFHLVDIINQTDLIEDIDGEEKLGQPMVHLSLVRRWGVVDLFVLPSFRERTFPGRRGRLRTRLVVDADGATYESGSKKHLDLAARYSHTLGDWDFGMYHFAGTGREPTFRLKRTSAKPGLFLEPYYEQIHQTGLDVQRVSGNWLYKLEALHRSGQDESFFACTGGFEYTFVNVAATGLDFGLIGEWAYDERGSKCTTGFDNDLMAGARLAFNDSASTEALMGIIQDMNNSGTIFTLEASRRITSHWKINVNAYLVLDSTKTEGLHDYRNDDYVQLELLYYF